MRVHSATRTPWAAPPSTDTNIGIYSDHWREYERSSRLGLLRILVIVLCLPVLAALGYVTSRFGEWTTIALVVLLVAWLVALTLAVVQQSRVTCPQCTGRYSRGKGLSNCPHCGLRMLQENP